MAKHEVFPHSGFQQLASDVWWLRGGQPAPLYRNMIVVRLAGGNLVLHSVVAIDDAALRELEAIGVPTYAIIPSRGHKRDIPFYKQRYPKLKALAPAADFKIIAAKVPVDASVEDILPRVGFKLHKLPGVKAPEFVYEFPLASGGKLLMSNDAFGSGHHYDERRLLGRLVMRHLGAPEGRLGIARIFRWVMAKDVAALKHFAGELAKIPNLRWLTVSHGDPVPDPAPALKAIAAS
jgi:hypothetical protein